MPFYGLKQDRALSSHRTREGPSLDIVLSFAIPTQASPNLLLVLFVMISIIGRRLTLML